MITGQSEKERLFAEKIAEKNRNRERKPRIYQESKMRLHDG